jgi:uncharacterized protein
VLQWPIVELTALQQQTLMDLSRQVIRKSLAGESSVSFAVPDPALHQPAGCFVSLHRLVTHKLRGCVGRLEANGPLWEMVAQTSMNVLRDPRFTEEAVTIDELPELSLELSVLSPLQPAASPLAFDPQKDGIYLMCCGRTGCFLPQVARETGWSREQLLGRLCSEKMGLPPTFWMQAGAQLMTFTTLIIGPEPFERVGQNAAGPNTPPPQAY